MIYIITHKQFKSVTDIEFYKPLLVGADRGQCTAYALCDNTGDNISSRNQNFCELTGLYWIWKNTNEDTVGICHYRRYFTKRKVFRKNGLPDENLLTSILNQYDMILPRKKWFNGRNAKDFYGKYHKIDDWNRMVSVAIRLYPEYEKDIRWFERQKSGYCYNMFATRRNLLDDYCSWLFSILFELEKSTDIGRYSEYNRRIYGFLAERMINIWVHHNILKVFETYLYNPEYLSMNVQKAKAYILRKVHGEKR